MHGCCMVLDHAKAVIPLQSCSSHSYSKRNIAFLSDQREGKHFQKAKKCCARSFCFWSWCRDSVMRVAKLFQLIGGIVARRFWAESPEQEGKWHFCASVVTPVKTCVVASSLSMNPPACELHNCEQETDAFFGLHWCIESSEPQNPQSEILRLSRMNPPVASSRRTSGHSRRKTCWNKKSGNLSDCRQRSLMMAWWWLCKMGNGTRETCVSSRHQNL